MRNVRDELTHPGLGRIALTNEMFSAWPRLKAIFEICYLIGLVAPVLAGFLWSTWGLTVLMGARVLLAIATEVYAVSIVRSAESRKLRLDPLAREVRAP